MSWIACPFLWLLKAQKAFVLRTTGPLLEREFNAQLQDTR